MSLFPVEIFCLTVPKNAVGEHFCAVFQKISGSKKFMHEKGGRRVSRFPVENFFVSRCQKNCRGTLWPVIIFGYRKILCFRGLCHDFPSKVFFLTVPKHFAEEPFYAVFEKISGSAKVYG